MIDELLDKGTLKLLDDSSVERIRNLYGPGEVRTVYLPPVTAHWQPGDGAPAIVADTPAIAQAMGRCAASRSMRGDIGAIDGDFIHPIECGWCGWPLDVLLAALDHAAWKARMVDVEFETWEFQYGKRYVRDTGRSGQYDNPEWAKFHSMLGIDKASAIQEAKGW